MNLFRNPRFLSIVAGTAFAVSLLASVPVAQAATLSTVQIQAIVNLLQAFNADATTIANVQAALENTATSTVVATSTTSTNGTGQTSGQNGNGGTCSILSTSLQVGSTDEHTGGEVSRLQAFLMHKNMFPTDRVTGFFGPATRAAVEKWQDEKGIASSTNANANGFGHVGPRTRGEMNKEMEMECENGDAHSSLGETASSTASSTISHEN